MLGMLMVIFLMVKQVDDSFLRSRSRADGRTCAGRGRQHDHHRIHQRRINRRARARTAPAATARELGLAHYAARGVLEYVLARHGATFAQQIALRAAINADAPQTPDELVAQVQGPSRRIRPVSAPYSMSSRPRSCSSPTVSTFGPRRRGASSSQPSPRRPPPSPPASGADSGGGSAAAYRVLALVTERADAELAVLTA